MAFSKVRGPGITTDDNYRVGVITATKFIGEMESAGGDSTFQNVTIDGNLTVQGDTTTLNTTLRNVELLRVAANNGTATAGIITQTGSGDILNLFDATTEVMTVVDGGNVGLGMTDPEGLLHLKGANPQLIVMDTDTTEGNTSATLRLANASAAGQTNHYFNIKKEGTDLVIDDGQIGSGVEERLRINSSGYVGINTTVMSNAERLAVQLGNDEMFELRSAAQELFQVWKESSTEETRLNIKHNGSTKIHLRGNGVSYFNGGNIGIGTANPQSLIHTQASGSNGLMMQTPLGDHYIWGIQADGNLMNSSTAGDLGIRGKSGISISGNNGTATQVRIDSGGRLLVGQTSGFDLYANGLLQVSATSGTAAISVTRFSNNSSSPYINLGKSRGAVGTYTTVHDDDRLGQINFCGADGTDLASPAAGIAGYVDGTPGGNDMPGRLLFFTASDNDASFEKERLRIDSSGRVVISNNAGNHTGGSQFVVMGGAINSYASAAFGNYTAAPTSGTTFAMFRFNSGSTGTSRGAEIIAAADANWAAGSSYPTRLVFSTTAASATSSTERLRIDAIGEVKIGAGNSGTSMTEFGSGTGGLTIDDVGVTNTGIRLSHGNDDTYLVQSSNNNFYIAQYGDGDMIFGVGATGNHRLSILNDGVVRIQQTSTNAKLLLSRNESVPTDDTETGVIDFANNTQHTVNARIMAKTSGTGNVGGCLLVETRDESNSTLTEKLRIKSNGNVGIGITNPNARIEITDTGTAQIRTGYNATKYARIGRASNGHYEFFSQENGSPLVFGTAESSDGGGAEKMRIDRYGNVGIGTQNPGNNGERLIVRKDVAAASGKATIGIHNLHHTGSSSASTGELNFIFKNYNASHSWWGGRIACFNTDNYNQYTYLRFDTASQGNAAGKMWLTHNGKLGIGTANPWGQLHIYAADDGEGTAKGQIFLKDNAAYNASPSSGIVFQGHHASNHGQAIFSGIRGFKANGNDGDYDGCLAFDVRTHGAVAFEAMRINEYGTVGINTVDGRFNNGNSAASNQLYTNIPKLGVHGSIVVGNLSGTATDVRELAFYRRGGPTPGSPVSTHKLGRIAWYGSSNDSAFPDKVWSLECIPNGNGWTAGSNRRAYLSFVNHDGEKIRINSNGYMSIGERTDQSTDLLHVNSFGKNIEAIGIGASSEGIRLGWEGDNSAYDSVRIYRTNYSTSEQFGMGSSWPCTVITPTTSPGSGISNETLWLKSTGSGSGSTSQHLTVDGTVVVGGNGEVNGGTTSGYPISRRAGFGDSKLTIQPNDRTSAFAAATGSTWHDVIIKQSGSATNNAVGIAFEVSTSGYHHNAGTGIAAVKNGTNSDYGSDLVFVTRPQSLVASEKVRIYAHQGISMKTNATSTSATSWKASNSGVGYGVRTRIYPYWVSDTGACRFNINMGPASNINTPRFWIFTNAVTDQAGEVIITANRRVNSPNNAQQRFHHSKWSVGMYGEGDNDFSASRWNKLALPAQIGGNTIDVDGSNNANYYYVATNHGEYNTNDNQYQNGYGGWYWHLDSGSYWQAQPVTFDMYFAAGGDINTYTWYAYIDD